MIVQAYFTLVVVIGVLLVFLIFLKRATFYVQKKYPKSVFPSDSRYFSHKETLVLDAKRQIVLFSIQQCDYALVLTDTTHSLHPLPLVSPMVVNEEETPSI